MGSVTEVVLDQLAQLAQLAEQRRLLRNQPALPLTEYICENLAGGTYGKLGDEPLRRVVLKDMSGAHIKAILLTQVQISGERRGYFMQELFLRAHKGYTIED